MKKRAAAMAMVFLMLLGIFSGTALAAEAPWAADAVSTLNGIYGSGVFSAEDENMTEYNAETVLKIMGCTISALILDDVDTVLSRGEACELLAEIFMLPVSEGGSAIQYLYDRNIINGYSDGSLGADVPITHAQFAVLTYRVLNATGGGLGSSVPVLKPGTKEYFSWFYLATRRGVSFRTDSCSEPIDQDMWNVWLEAVHNINIPQDHRPSVDFQPNCPSGITRLQAAVQFVDACIEAGASKHIFWDVPTEYPFYGSVMYLFDHGIINGEGKGNFQPFDNVPRIQLAVLLYQAAHLTQQPDEADNTMELAKAFVIEHGYLSVSDSEGGGWSDYVTREETVTAIIKMYADQKLIDFDPDQVNTAVLNRFGDKELISEECRPYLAYAVSLGLVNGTADGKLQPDALTPRGQAAILLYRVLLGVDKTKMQDYRECVEYAKTPAEARTFRMTRTTTPDYTLTLREDWRLTSNLDLAVPEGKTLQIDGNGHHIYEMGGTLQNSGGGTVVFGDDTVLYPAGQSGSCTPETSAELISQRQSKDALLSFSGNTVTFQIRSENIETATICVASYDGDGRLMDVSTETVSVDPGWNTVAFDQWSTDGNVRLFLLNGDGSFAPLCGSYAP